MKQFPEQTPNELEKRYRTTLFIVGAQISTVIILTIIAWFVAGQAPATVFSPLVSFLWILILVVAIGAFLMRRVLFAPAVLKDTATIKGASGLLRSLQTKTIILSGMGELIAVTGFIVSFLSGDKYDMLRAAIIALIVFFINFPRKSVWLRVTQASVK